VSQHAQGSIGGGERSGMVASRLGLERMCHMLGYQYMVLTCMMSGLGVVVRRVGAGIGDEAENWILGFGERHRPFGMYTSGLKLGFRF
jgi:hypothetical protein